MNKTTRHAERRYRSALAILNAAATHDKVSTLRYYDKRSTGRAVNVFAFMWRADEKIRARMYEAFDQMARLADSATVTNRGGHRFTFVGKIRPARAGR